MMMASTRFATARPAVGNNLAKSWQRWRHTKKAYLRIGVVGYSNQDFDHDTAVKFIRAAFDSFGPTVRIEIVSGLTDMGIPALAYREAVRRGWKTVGVACSKAFKHLCFPVDDAIIHGDDWGDESDLFIDRVDQLIRIGGGAQSHCEAYAAKLQGKRVIEYELPAVAHVSD